MRGFIVCCIAMWLGPVAAQTGVYDDLPMDVMEHGETPHEAVGRIRTGGDEDQTAPFHYRPTAERSWSAEARQIDSSLSQADFAFLSASEPSAADFDGDDRDDKDQEHDERDAERDRDRAERDAERHEEKEDKEDKDESDDDRDDDHGGGGDDGDDD